MFTWILSFQDQFPTSNEKQVSSVKISLSPHEKKKKKGKIKSPEKCNFGKRRNTCSVEQPVHTDPSLLGKTGLA